MVARAASQVSEVTPLERPRLAIAGDGTLAAIAESTRVVIVELPSGAPAAEIRLDAGALVSEIAWLGARLFVMSRYATHATAYLVDPHGPRTIAELRLEPPMRLLSTVGPHALTVGDRGAAVMTAGEAHLTPYQLPARSVPAVAGAAGGHFVVALAGSIEEWDPAARMPRRRLRLPRPAAITNLGGSERVVWMTTQQDPARIDVIPLVNRGQPKHHELPEPIAQITGHPRSDLLACVGADSGKLYVVDLDGRARLRVLAPEGLERTEAAALVVGRMVGVLAAQTGRPIDVLALEERDAAAPVVAPAVAPVVAPAVLAPADEAPPRRSTLTDDEPAAASLAERRSSWRDKAPPRAAPVAALPRAEHRPSWRAEPVAATPRAEHRPSWRDEAVAWTRAVTAGFVDSSVDGSVDRGAPSCPPIDELAARFELAANLVPALVLLYGAHLGGERGVAPVDVARVLGRRWDEALGRGELAARGLARFADSRLRLAPALQRALDELPIATGTLVGEPGPVALLGPCVIVAGGEPLADLAADYLARVGGAVLVAADDADPRELFAEARVRGAAPMLRLAAADAFAPGAEPAIFVVEDAALADQLGVPRLG